MHAHVARILLLLVVFTLAVPESFAKRAGSGRSSGRQSSALRQKPAAPPVARTAPAAPPAAPAQRAQPDVPATPTTPAAPAPQHTLPRQASSPWGGMLGGALLGLGLGSVMSSNDRPSEATQSEGGNGSDTGSGASGAGEAAMATQQAHEPVPQNKLGPGLLLAVLAAIVFLTVRRLRTHRR